MVKINLFKKWVNVFSFGDRKQCAVNNVRILRNVLLVSFMEECGMSIGLDKSQSTIESGQSVKSRAQWLFGHSMQGNYSTHTVR
ncbi:hypothetical protein DMENIID0001_037690 [Sergentomyia squamirostris]